MGMNEIYSKRNVRVFTELSYLHGLQRAVIDHVHHLLREIGHHQFRSFLQTAITAYLTLDIRQPTLIFLKDKTWECRVSTLIVLL